MSERAEIIFMQVRMLRLALEEWHMPIQKANELFDQYGILKFMKTVMVCFIWKAILRYSMKLKPS